MNLVLKYFFLAVNSGGQRLQLEGKIHEMQQVSKEYDELLNLFRTFEFMRSDAQAQPSNIKNQELQDMFDYEQETNMMLLEYERVDDFKGIDPWSLGYTPEYFKQ